MTFADDHLHLDTPSGVHLVPCQSLGLEWPPPERVNINGVTYERQTLSSITDEQREGMTNVCRGALYTPRLDA